MNRAPKIDLSHAGPGEATCRFVDSNSRSGVDLSAFLSRLRPAERAPGSHLIALRLAFDSFREPVPAGRRGGHHGDRHLVYMSRDYAIDVRLEAQEHDADILRGELLSLGDGPVAEVPTFLLEGDQIAGYDRTGPLGEFEIATDGALDLRLCLLLDADRCIDLPIDLTSARLPAAEA